VKGGDGGDGGDGGGTVHEKQDWMTTKDDDGKCHQGAHSHRGYDYSALV